MLKQKFKSQKLLDVKTLRSFSEHLSRKVASLSEVYSHSPFGFIQSSYLDSELTIALRGYFYPNILKCRICGSPCCIVTHPVGIIPVDLHTGSLNAPVTPCYTCSNRECANSLTNIPAVLPFSSSVRHNFYLDRR